MEEVYLLLGGNLGDRCSYINKARELVAKQLGDILNESALYETEPWGAVNSPMFLNCVIKLRTSLEPFEFLTRMLQIEIQLGRIRTGEINGSRTIDIDILFFGNRVISSEALQIPHPRLHLRRFALIPLESVAPEFRHPVTGLSIAQMLSCCPDQLLVTEYVPLGHLS